MLATRARVPSGSGPEAHDLGDCAEGELFSQTGTPALGEQ